MRAEIVVGDNCHSVDIVVGDAADGWLLMLLLLKLLEAFLVDSSADDVVLSVVRVDCDLITLVFLLLLPSNQRHES